MTNADLIRKIEQLEEQLIQMCRVFHGIDCDCKWCRIVKERAVDMERAADMEKRRFNGYDPEDYPLQSGATWTDKRRVI